MILVDPVAERFLLRAVAAYSAAMRRNGMRPPRALVELEAALGDLNRQQAAAFDADTGPGDDKPMALVFEVDEVAVALRVSPRSVERLIADGSLPSVKIGRSRRVRAEDLRRFVNELPATKGKDHE